MDASILTLIIALLLTAVCVSVAFHYLKIPSIIGYIVVGIMLGPQVLGWIEKGPEIRGIAEFGIVFLLFTVGLDFSLSKLIAMRAIVFGYGSLQVIISVIATFLVSLYFNMNISSALIVGGVVAISSTAIALKQLSDQNELYTQHGNNALGILLLQDLAVIPFLMLIPNMGSALNTPIAAAILLALLKGIAVIILILLLGQKILRPLLQKIASTQSIELFTLTVLLISLSIAWFTNLIGLSLSLGAFLAGIMLGETEFRHQINLEIRPFRDVLLGLFFITIGMQLNLQNLPETWPWVLLLLAGILIFKPALITVLGILLRQSAQTSLRAGLILAQGSEFSFAILLLAYQYELLSANYTQVILAGLLLSMMLSPVLIRYNGVIAKKLCPSKTKPKQANNSSIIAPFVDEKHRQHAIICGYGRVGQNIVQLLRQQDYFYTIIDLDPKRTEEATATGEEIIYGNASHHAILQAAGIGVAKTLVICMSDHSTTLKIIQQVRQISQKIPIIVRSYDDSNLAILRQAGATEIVPEVQETSLILGSHILLWMGTPAVQVLQLIDKTRHDNYELFSKIVTIGNSNSQLHEKRLHLIELSDDAFAVGKTLSELCLDEINVDIVATKRKGIHSLQPAPMMILQGGDVLILFAETSDLEQAEQYLLSGFVPH
jgi:monovalent cation:H+ antiporter-2, CPA2 family